VNTPKRLYRSTQDRMFAGVCGGIAEYLEVDPTLVRLAFVALTLLGGPGLVIYIVLMLIVPEKPQEEWQPKAKHTEPTSLVKSSVPVPDSDVETDSPPDEPEA
jgi:phage shock protein C